MGRRTMFEKDHTKTLLIQPRTERSAMDTAMQLIYKRGTGGAEVRMNRQEFMREAIRQMVTRVENGTFEIPDDRPAYEAEIVRALKPR